MEEKTKATLGRMAMQTLPAVKAKRPFQVSKMPQKNRTGFPYENFGKDV